MTGRGDGHFLAGVLDSPRPFALRVARTSALLASTTTLAADSRARRRGLIGRDSLGPGEVGGLELLAPRPDQLEGALQHDLEAGQLLVAEVLALVA